MTLDDVVRADAETRVLPFVGRCPGDGEPHFYLAEQPVVPDPKGYKSCKYHGPNGQGGTSQD